MSSTVEHLRKLFSRLKHLAVVRMANFLAAIIGAIAALLSLLVVGQDALPALSAFFRSLFGGLGFLAIGAANNASGEPTGEMHFEIIPVVMLVLLLVLVVAFFWALKVAFGAQSSNEKAAERAWDIVKLLAGFFVGTLTGYLGSQ